MKKKTVLQLIRWSSFFASILVLIYGREGFVFLSSVFGGLLLVISLEASRKIGEMKQKKKMIESFLHITSTLEKQYQDEADLERQVYETEESYSYRKMHRSTIANVMRYISDAISNTK